MILPHHNLDSLHQISIAITQAVSGDWILRLVFRSLGP